jgi:mRNA interferase HigB
MHVIGLGVIDEFAKNHADSRKKFKAWIDDAQLAEWKDSMDIRNRYSNADPIPNNRIVFDIKGNRYRLVVKVNYQLGIAWVRFVGTHEEYDKIDATTI